MKYNLVNNYISFDRISEIKLNYINKRLGTNLNYQDLIDNKVVLNLYDVLNTNNIYNYTRDQRIVSELDQYFLGFISYDNAFINMRNLKRGGVSKGDYESLNFRTLGNDDIKNVLKNLEIVKEELGINYVCKGKQDHTDNVIIIDNKNKDEFLFEKLNAQKVDGYVVKDKDIATLITTADCNPIIIYDTKKNIVANVHAGWKGVLNRIYINAINIMKKEFLSDPKDLVVCIGPSIRKCCFTSKEEAFKEKFTSVFEYTDRYLFYEEDKETFHIDLIEILKTELKKANVLDKNIYVADICTRCNTDDFYSYRAAVQSGKKDYATMATIVQISENNVK